MAWRLKYNVSFPVTFADVLDNDFFSSSGDYITFIQNWEKTFPIRVTNDKGVDTNPAVNLMSYFTAYVYFSILQTFYFDRHKLLQKENTNYFFFSRLKNENQNIYSEDWLLESIWSIYKKDGIAINSLTESLFALAWIHCWYNLASFLATGKNPVRKSKFSDHFLAIRQANPDIFYAFFNEVARISISHALAALDRFAHLWLSFGESFELLRQIRESGAAEPLFFIQTPSYGNFGDHTGAPSFLLDQIQSFSSKNSYKIKSFADFIGSKKSLQAAKQVPGFVHILFKDFGNSLGPTPEDSGFENFCFHKSDYFNGLCFLDFACFIELFYDIDGLHPEDS